MNEETTHTTTPTRGAADLPAMVSKALREAYNLGQRYWQQADSEYISQHKKADDTRAKFLALVEETCAALAAGQATAAQAVVQDDLITIRKPTTSAEMLWLLKLAHLVISDVGKTLEESFAPAQAAEPSITLDFKMATDLLGMFCGEPGLVTLQRGDEHCHSGPGLYAWYSDMPEEGAGFLGAEPDDEATPSAPSAPAQPAAQQGVAYAALPTSSYAGRVFEEGFLVGTCPLYTADQLRAFADVTHALRASHGEAPAGTTVYPMACDEDESDLGAWQDGATKPTIDGIYLRDFDEGQGTSEFYEGKWLRDGFFPSDIQDARWRGRNAPQPSTTAQSADSVPAVSDLPPLPAPDLRDVGTKPQEIKEFLKGYATEYARTAIAARAPADSVQEDAARLDFLIEQRAYVVSDPDACPGYWLHWARPDGSTWVQVDEHPTPRAAIDAGRKQGARWKSAVRALPLHI